MATTLPADLRTLTEEELVALVATCSDDEDALDALLAELDTREDDADSDDPAHEPSEEERLRDLVTQSRRPGETLDQCVDRMYGEHTYQRYLAAETYCRGRMLRRADESADVIDPYTLFHGPARAAAKHASEELMAWWRENGRETWIEFKYRHLGRPGDRAAADRARRATQDWIR
jgi:hypothetical protein